MLRGLIRPISKEVLESKFRIYYTVNADKTVTHKTPVPDHAHILVDVTTRQVDAVTTRRSAHMRETGTPSTNSGVVAW